MKSRLRVISACGLAALLFGLLLAGYGYDDTWELWNIPLMSTYFSDLRTITGGAESYAQGFDPMVMNPGDPGGRRLNYPRLWQSLYSLGIDQSHTLFIGIAFISLFIIGVCLILPHASYVMILLAMAAVLSPATLLGIERGNIDILMFFLVSVSVVAVKRWHAFSAAVILFGFALKLFPIFGCSVLLRASRSDFFRYILVISGFAALYITLTYSDLVLIKEATPKSIYLSYGLNVFWMNIATINPVMGGYAKVLSYLAVLCSLGCAYTALLREGHFPENQNQGVYLDAFRAGAAIFLGTFLLGNNWDYRLMFLILTIPQLVIWAKDARRHVAAGSGVVLSSIFISMWYLMLEKLAHGLPYGDYVSFALDEIAHWVVFIGLLYLFCWSMPNWIKDYVQKIHSLVSVR